MVPVSEPWSGPEQVPAVGSSVVDVIESLQASEPGVGSRPTVSEVDAANDSPNRTESPLPAARLEPSLSLQLRSFAPTRPESWQPLLDLAVAADRAGIGKLVVSDHVVFGDSMDDYGDPARGGVAGGKQPTGPDGEWLEPLTLLSVLAGRTERVRLGTNILLAALRRPVVLAKMLSTLDVLSGGRVDLGVGTGWQQTEYEAAGLDFSARGRLLDHSLEVCRTLWTQQPASYRSDELEFDTVHQMPTPLQPGGVPIWVSGTVNPRSMRRLARFGSGWIPWGPAVADVTRGIAEMRAAVTDLGRDPSDIAVVGTLPIAKQDGVIDLDATMASVEPLMAAGVTDFRAGLPALDDLDSNTEMLAEVVERFDSAVARGAT